MTAPDSATEPPRRLRLVSPGQKPAWHYGLLHDRDEITLLWLTRGQGRITLDGRRRGLGAHNAVFVPPRTLFAFDLAPQSLALVLHAAPPVMTEAALPETALHLRVRDALAQAELTSVLENIQREIARPRRYLDAALEAHLRLAAVWLRRQQSEGRSDRPEDSDAQRLLRDYAQTVVAQFRSDAGAAADAGDMAARLGVSCADLSRACRAACGRSAQRILSERRLHEAHRLLSAPEPAIASIAQRLGFATPDRFARFLHWQTGQTPGALRAGGSAPRRSATGPRPAVRAIRGS